MLTKAIAWQVIPINPALNAEVPPLPAGRVRYLQPTELRVLLEACPEWLRPIVGLAVFTGMRRGEILSLRYLDIDAGQGCILLPQTKNGEARGIPLNSNAMSVLNSLPEGKPLDRLFPRIKEANVSVAFHRACKSAGIEDFRFHDLRHTTGSWLAMSGKDIYTISKILGHKDLRMSARYSHLSAKYLSEAVKSLDTKYQEKKSISETVCPQSVPEAIDVIEAEVVNG
jgi:integrase